jgi:hypothetical protein
MVSKLSSKQGKQAGYLAGYFGRLFLSIFGCFLKTVFECLQVQFAGLRFVLLVSLVGSVMDLQKT